MKRAASRPAPCLACPQRTWRSLHGFMVMGCALKGLRFGTAPDIRRGHVNKAGDCVPMPEACGARGVADQRDAGQRRTGEMESGKRQTLPLYQRGVGGIQVAWKAQSPSLPLLQRGKGGRRATERASPIRDNPTHTRSNAR